MKTEMIIFDRKAVEAATKKRGYTTAELANELIYSEMGYASALKRNRMPLNKFKRLAKLLNVEESTLLPKQEKPVQESLFDATTADLLAELKAIRECLEGIAVMMETRF